MTRKATVVAPSNIALIKYWGTQDLDKTMPFNPSISMTLRECVTRTTVESVADQDMDEIQVRVAEGDLQTASPAFAEGVVAHLNQLRQWAGVGDRFRIATENSFPMGAGLASSASGFAALALAVMESLERDVSPGVASILARSSGSGSAARSVMGGFVEWPVEDSDRGEAAQLYPAEHWDLRDVVAILDTSQKRVSSRAGHKLAESSPYFEPRLAELPHRLAGVREAIADRDFESLAPVVEEEAIDLHLIAMSSRPPVFYWSPGSVAVLALVRDLRENGLEVCSTMDAGANVHCICTPEAQDPLVTALKELPAVQRVICDGVGQGPRSEDNHLF